MSVTVLIKILIKADDDISIKSMCIALVVRRVNKIAQHLEFAVPPRVMRVIMFQGPTALIATLGKGRVGSKRSAGRSTRQASLWPTSYNWAKLNGVIIVLVMK